MTRVKEVATVIWNIFIGRILKSLKIIPAIPGKDKVALIHGFDKNMNKDSKGPKVTRNDYFQLVIQEVPAFCDFWFQRVIMKCGDHEFRGLFLV